MATCTDLLARRLARDPGRPFVTYYDDATGERTELSVTTYANWVAKTANLFVDELMLDAGDRLAVRLPAHWLGAVFVTAAWSAGLELAAPDASDAVVVGPGDPAIDGSAAAGGGAVLACSLDPFAGRFRDPLPAQVLDYGALWPGQGDVFVPTEPVELADVEPDDRRVLTDLAPSDEGGRALLAGLLAGSGSLVISRNTPDARWPARRDDERATVILRSGQPTDG